MVEIEVVHNTGWFLFNVVEGERGRSKEDTSEESGIRWGEPALTHACFPWGQLSPECLMVPKSSPERYWCAQGQEKKIQVLI